MPGSNRIYTCTTGAEYENSRRPMIVFKRSILNEEDAVLQFLARHVFHSVNHSHQFHSNQIHDRSGFSLTPSDVARRYASGAEYENSRRPMIVFKRSILNEELIQKRKAEDVWVSEKLSMTHYARSLHLPSPRDFIMIRTGSRLSGQTRTFHSDSRKRASGTVTRSGAWQKELMDFDFRVKSVMRITILDWIIRHDQRRLKM
jgi:hypothetical protein